METMVNTDIMRQYDKFIKGYEPSNLICQDWPMQNGIYQQYSIYKNNTPSSSGTSASVKAL